MSFFAKNLRFLRKKSGYNQDEIAVLFSKQPNTIGNWENRKSEPSVQELIKLGEFFKVGMEDLLQVDLEQQSQGSPPSITEDALTGSGSSQHLIDRPGGQIKEAGPDAFWLILRELRAVHEKIDLLIANRESGAQKRNADKSNH